MSAALSALIACCLGIALLAQAPSTTAAPAAAKPSAPSSAKPTVGSELFRTTCRVCHGEAGIGGVGPALRGAKFTRPYVRRAMWKDVQAR